ncbi:MAG: hypothetical protein H7A43_03825 [Verrucomicrobia bacterium]|nr:hypothetical protein [Kiritimatiellia bacterium]MCP5487756.1 hypothetical protein [Verrucomicrobiota bacterium]
MNQPAQPQTAVIEDGDIVFDCPSCAKSLGIDYHGAGYLVTCPHCGLEIQVPEVEVVEDPEGHIADAAHAQIALDDTTRMLNEKIIGLQKQQAATRKQFEKIGAEINELQKALDRMVALLTEAENG